MRESLESLQAKWSTLPGNFRGAVWALLAAMAFSCMQASIKEAGQTLPVWQILVLRSAIALAVIAPVVWRAGPTSLRTRRPGMHALRAFLGFCGISTLVMSLQHLDLAVVSTLSFANTFIVILLAWAFLGEKIVAARMWATVIGFVGVAICIQPGPEGVNVWALAMLASAAFAAGVTTTVKSLTRTERPTTIMFWAYVAIMLLALPLALLDWTTPTFRDAALVGLMAIFTTMGQSCMVLALRAGDAVAVTPFSYTRVLYAGLLGFFIFGEIPAWSTFAGAAVIIAAMFYLMLMERRGALRRAGDAP